MIRHYILPTCLYKFLHACVASYMRVHARKISMHVFVSAVCVSHVWDTCETCVWTI